MRKRDAFVFLLGMAVAALVGWMWYEAYGLIPHGSGHASMVREMDGGRCTVVVGWSTAKDADVKKRWPNEPRARESTYMGCSSISPDRLEKGGNEEHVWVFSSQKEAIEYRDRLLRAIGKEE